MFLFLFQSIIFLLAQTAPGSAKSDHKPYFLGNAVDFVIQHGQEYALFDPFFNKSSYYDSSKETKLRKHYFVHNHTAHYLLGRAQTTINPEYTLWPHYSFHGVPDIPKDLLEANNKFRFGHGTNDRFTDIFISEDPWVSEHELGIEHSRIDFSEQIHNDKLLSQAISKVPVDEPYGYYDFATGIKSLARRFNAAPEDVRKMLSTYTNLKKEGKEFVHFVGLRPGWLPDPWGSEIQSIPDRTDLDRAVCAFTYPYQAERPLQIIGNWTLGCEIPFNISSHISKEHLAEQHSIMLRFDLIIGSEIALRQVQLKRIHAIDRRQFNYTVCTMVDDINSPLLIQWLTYHSLIGIEHFYILDNSKMINHSSAYLWESRIRPYLDANVVTLIHFPFISPTNVSWNSIQEHSFYTAVQKYGVYSKWMGFFDIDEYFGLDEKRWPSYSKDPLGYLRIIPNTIEEIWNSAGHDDRVPAIVFDTIEMGCSVYSETNVGGVVPKKFKHAALSRYCTHSGFRFSQNPKAQKTVGYGHGKLFVRPQKLLEPYIVGIMQPHQIDSIYTLFPPENYRKSSKSSYPLFYHFDNFHYGLNRTSGKDYTLARLCGRVVDIAMGEAV